MNEMIWKKEFNTILYLYLSFILRSIIISRIRIINVTNINIIGTIPIKILCCHNGTLTYDIALEDIIILSSFSWNFSNPKFDEYKSLPTKVIFSPLM